MKYSKAAVILVTFLGMVAFASPNSANADNNNGNNGNHYGNANNGNNGNHYGHVRGAPGPIAGVRGAPGPIAGAGLPILAIGYGVYWLVKRRRKID